ncbi:type II toxin-antitoxin system RelE/ParE family toxin [Sulfurospirillum cavolei]|uniref:type II toxin-antitoxin system RelE/ParE family toxin n=1 Tax=Sulfurospirillum cavolei TaxID=366522 RepID=UPI003FA2CDA8
MNMRVEFKESFVKRFEAQLRFIANDSPQNAQKFKNELLKQIASLTLHPLKCRKSIYFDDESIRDLVYKGYTIVYLIDEDKIEIFGLTKYQEHVAD